MVKKPTTIETIRLNRLCLFGHVQRMEENRVPRNVLYMNLEATRLRGRPRNRWQDEVREDRRLVFGKGWKERVYNREEWKKLLWMAQNCRILHMPMEQMNEFYLFPFSLLQWQFAAQIYYYKYCENSVLNCLLLQIIKYVFIECNVTVWYSECTMNSVTCLQTMVCLTGSAATNAIL